MNKIGALSASIITMVAIAAVTSNAYAGNQKPITLTFFSNNPDRTTGQGLAEQSLIDEYQKLHPNIKIQVSTLGPDTAYQNKFKVFGSVHKLPDVVMWWGVPDLIDPEIQSNSLAALPLSMFKKDQFVSGSLTGFEHNGKMYGVPKNGDFLGIYYNKALFRKAGISSPPKTDTQLFADFSKLKAKGIVPIATDGTDGYIYDLWLRAEVDREAGSYQPIVNALDGKVSFNQPAILKAASELQNWVKAGAFGSGYLTMTDSQAQNLFGQGQAAMYISGEWNAGMYSNSAFPSSVRDNMGFYNFPAVPGGKGKQSDLTAWFGGGFSVAANSTQLTAAEQFLAWLIAPQNWATYVIEHGITFPAQNISSIVKHTKLTPVMTDLAVAYTHATQVMPFVVGLNSADQTTYYSYLDQLLSSKLTPQQFAAKMDPVAAHSAKSNA